MNIFWLQQTEANVPAEKDWLAPAELLRIEGMRFLKRRRDYLLGRWTAKCALAAYLDWPTYADVLSDIDVGTAPSGAPTVMIRGERAQLVVSISHCSGQAICSVAHSGIALGCDLELVEPRSDAFLRDYFTAEEQEIVEAAPEPDRAWLVTLFWSAKESALKALQEGLRLDTRSVVVRLVEAEKHPANEANSKSDICQQVLDRPWNRFELTCQDSARFQGWSQYAHGFVRTIVGTSPCAQPISLASRVVGKFSTGVSDQALSETMPLRAGLRHVDISSRIQTEKAN